MSGWPRSQKRDPGHLPIFVRGDCSLIFDRPSVVQRSEIGSLLQPAANQIQRLLTGPCANMFPIATKSPFHHFGLLAISYGDVNQTDRLLLRAPARTGDACNSQA